MGAVGGGVGVGAGVANCLERACAFALALVFCNARMTSSNVRPCDFRSPAAGLFPSPTTAARTIAPSIWRRRDCWAACTAACRTRSSSGSVAGSAPFSARMSSSSRPRYPETSVPSRTRSTLLACRTADASVSSVNANSKCSSVTARWPCSRANPCARSRLSPRVDDMGIDLKASATGCGINNSPVTARKSARGLSQGPLCSTAVSGCLCKFPTLYPIDRAASWPRTKDPVREQSHNREQIPLSAAAGRL